MAINVTLGVVADYANVSREGKLNIMGMFDVIYATSVPTVHNQMQLVMSFEADRTEANKEHEIKIELIDAEGIKTPVQIGGNFNFKPPPPGEEMKFNHILQLNRVRFAKEGSYNFKINIDGETKHSILLKVVLIRTK